MTVSRTIYGLEVSTKTLDIPYEIDVTDLRLVDQVSLDTATQKGFELTFKILNVDDDSLSSFLYVKRLVDKKGTDPKVRTTFRFLFPEVYDAGDGTDPVVYWTEDVHTTNRSVKGWKGNAWTLRAGAIANTALMGVIDDTSHETDMRYFYNAVSGTLQPFA